MPESGERHFLTQTQTHPRPDTTQIDAYLKINFFQQKVNNFKLLKHLQII